MSEEKDDKSNSELNEELVKLVKDAVENLEILDNKNIREFLKGKKISNIPSQILIRFEECINNDGK